MMKRWAGLTRRQRSQITNNGSAKFHLVIAGVVLLTLSACGGGGDGGSAPPVPVPTAPPVPVPTAPPVPVPTVTDAFNELNRLRAAVGLNTVIQNTQIAAAADKHALYLTINSVTSSASSYHTEDPTKGGFTGVAPSDRAVSAGYPAESWVSEVVAVNENTWDPVKQIRYLMNAPYHGLNMLNGYQEVGMSSRLDGIARWLVVDLAAKPGAYASIPVGDVRIWPCNGVDNILNKYDDDELPAPIPGRDTKTDPIGTPIYVMVNESNALTLTNYEIRNTATNQAAAVVKVIYARSSSMAILPDKPLATKTAYTVSITGLNNGQSFSKTCQFTTSD